MGACAALGLTSQVSWVCNRVLRCYFSVIEPPGVAKPPLSQHQMAS